MSGILLRSFALTRTGGMNIFSSNFTSGSRLNFKSIMNASQRHNSKQLNSIRLYSNEHSVTPGGHATRKPTPFQQKMLVWGKMYPSVDKVPERVSIGQLKKAMDIFRVRSSICMAALVFILAAVMAMIGRKQRHDGITVTQIVLERRKQDQEKRE